MAARLLLTGLIGVLVFSLGGCGGTAVGSDLTLLGDQKALLSLKQETQALFLQNKSDLPVDIKVLDRRLRTLQTMTLGPHNEFTLLLEDARSIEFKNPSPEIASLRWELRDDGSKIESQMVHVSVP